MPEVGQCVKWMGGKWLVRSVSRRDRWVTLMKPSADLSEPEGPRISWWDIEPCA